MNREEGEDRPLTRRECDRCTLHQEVLNLKGWVSKIDTRMWAGLVVAMVNLLAAVGTLVVLILKQAPAVAAMAGK